MKSVEIIRAEERHDWNTNASFYRRDERSPLMRMLAARRESFYQFRSGQRILDLGCGTGGTVARLRAQGVKAVGVDFSPAMIEAAVAQHGLAQFVAAGPVGTHGLAEIIERPRTAGARQRSDGGEGVCHVADADRLRLEDHGHMDLLRPDGRQHLLLPGQGP